MEEYCEEVERYDCTEESSEDEYYECKHCFKPFDTLKGATYHENVHCKKKNPYRGCSKRGRENSCKRCGRSGHYASSCYATTNVKGFSIY